MAVAALGCVVLGCGELGEGGGEVIVPVSVASSSGCGMLDCGELRDGGEGGEGVVGKVGAESSSERKVPSVSSSESVVLVWFISS